VSLAKNEDVSKSIQLVLLAYNTLYNSIQHIQSSIEIGQVAQKIREATNPDQLTKFKLNVLFRAAIDLHEIGMTTIYQFVARGFQSAADLLTFCGEYIVRQINQLKKQINCVYHRISYADIYKQLSSY
jgi:hypothetical protein